MPGKLYLTLFDLKGAYGSYTLHWIGTRTGTGNEEMGLQPICLSPIPCHCPYEVCTVEGIIYKLIVAGASPIPVPGPCSVYEQLVVPKIAWNGYTIKIPQYHRFLLPANKVWGKVMSTGCCKEGTRKEGTIKGGTRKGMP